jgi:hypothetical protein
MDLHDKQFDNWVKDKLNAEISLSKQNRQAAWEQLRMAALQPSSATALGVADDFVHATAPVIREPLQARVLRWVSYLITQEKTYQKAHANSVHYYKANPNYSGGLTLHGLEIMRHRWTCAV